MLCDERQGSIDPRLCKIHADALPDEERARVLAIASGAQLSAKIIRLEVDGDELDIRGYVHALQHRALLHLCHGMIDLEHRNVLERGDPIGPRVEPGTEDHDLRETPLRLGDNDVLDELLAHDGKRQHRRDADQAIEAGELHEA
jgi:hypothetical protein